MKRWRNELAVIAIAVALPFVPMLLRGQVPVFRDHRDYFLPLREFTASALRSMSLPLWNPFNASGEPWLANPQTGVFYPPAWLFEAFPLRFAYVAFLVLHLVVLGAGAFVLFRRWVTRDAALTGALAFSLSGPVLSLLDVSNNLASLAWIPWIIVAAVDRDDASHTRDALALTLCFLGGEPFLAAIGAALYVAIRLVRERISAVRSVAVTGIVALLLSSAQLVPFAESLQGSDRAAGLEPAAALKDSLSPADWLALPLSPSGPDGSASRVARSQSFLPSIYLSPLIVLFAAGAPALLFLSGMPVSRRVAAAWAALFVAMLSGAAGSHAAWIASLYTEMHLNVNRYPAKLAPIGVLALAYFGARALDEARAAARSRRMAAVVSMALVALTAVALFQPRPWPSAILIVWAGIAALLMLSSGAQRSNAIAWTLMALVCADSIAASRFLFVAGELKRDVQPYASALDRTEKVIRLEQYDRRLAAATGALDRAAWLGGYLNLRNGQFDASTAAPVVSANYQLLHDYALAAPRFDILDMLSVGYVMTARELSRPGLEKVAASGGVNTYRREGPLPMVTVWENYSVVPDDATALKCVFDIRDVAASRVFVSGVLPPRGDGLPNGPAGRAAIRSFGLNSVDAVVDSDRGGLVMLNQRDAQGWEVSVDGVASSPVRVDGLFRGVLVPPGRHEVTWRYRPASVGIGLALSIAGVATCGVEISRRRRTRQLA